MDRPRLDVDHARSHFPAFAQPELAGWAHFENAGGSYPCAETIDALHAYYVHTRVQPGHPSPAAEAAQSAMDRAHERWATALGVDVDEVLFGPSTSANTFVLAHAFGERLGPGDEVVVTLQDHEANSGAIRRAATRAGAAVREWTVDPDTGLLDPAGLAELLGDRTRLVCMPHVSNIIGVENDVARVAAMVHAVGATLLVDGVSAAPHGLPDIDALGCDIYLCSLYKVFSVHQGLMVIRGGLARTLPNQGHFFNDGDVRKRLNPAGPDHAQVAASAAVLDYVDAMGDHHGVVPREVTRLWQDHETRLLTPVLDQLSGSDRVRVLGPASASSPGGGRHRCPTVAFVPLDRTPTEAAQVLRQHRIMAGIGHFYAWRTLEAVGVDPGTGVVRISFVHYTSDAEIAQLQTALAELIG